MAQTPLSSLLQLPDELQLRIYEFAAVESKPLLITLPCNAPYRNRRDQEVLDFQKWESGELHAPKQPPLTLTCRSIRRKALPFFYGQNIFRAAYCKIENSIYAAYKGNSKLEDAIKWLEAIGRENREMLRHFYFYDRDPWQNTLRTLQWRKCLDICAFSMGGHAETLSSDYCCAHLVTFGEYKRRPREIPVAAEAAAPMLTMEGEEICEDSWGGEIWPMDMSISRGSSRLR